MAANNALKNNYASRQVLMFFINVGSLIPLNKMSFPEQICLGISIVMRECTVLVANHTILNIYRFLSPYHHNYK